MTSEARYGRVYVYERIQQPYLIALVQQLRHKGRSQVSGAAQHQDAFHLRRRRNARFDPVHRNNQVLAQADTANTQKHQQPTQHSHGARKAAYQEKVIDHDEHGYNQADSSTNHQCLVPIRITTSPGIKTVEMEDRYGKDRP